MGGGGEEKAGARVLLIAVTIVAMVVGVVVVVVAKPTLAGGGASSLHSSVPGLKWDIGCLLDITQCGRGRERHGSSDGRSGDRVEEGALCCC